MTEADELAQALRMCLDADDPDAALLALARSPERLARISMEEGPFGFPRPHEIVGVAIHLMAGAMIRSGAPAEATAFVEAAAAMFDWGHRYYVRATDFGDLIGAFPFLCVTGIAASIAEKDWTEAAAAVLTFEDATRAAIDGGAPQTPEATALLTHPRAGRYGPFRYEPSWVLARQEEVLAANALDRRLERTRTFFQQFLDNALIVGEPARGLPLVEAEGIAVVPVGDTRGGHFELDAICVLAALGRLDEAFGAARRLVRDGYGARWRFDLAEAAKMPWTQKIRQNEWLAGLAATPRYDAFLRDEVRHEAFPLDDPTQTALCAVREDRWAGTKKKRCWLSRKLIAPGDPVVRTRRLHGHAPDGGFDIAAKGAFDASGWAAARRAFESDAIPLACLFPPPRRMYVCDWHTPAIAAFHFDVARDAAAFDLDRAVALVADHAPNPIRHEWVRGRYDYAAAFEPLTGDVGHGDAVNLVWRLIKAGFAADLFTRVARLAPETADKVFAMLAVFDRADCRDAAAVHFGLPELPAMMALAFTEKPSLAAHLALADFADAQPRWRAGLVAAMRAYALHLYSNTHPGADWFLAGLEHFTRGRCCQLLFFLIHHPEDDPVLATMLERQWLPSGVGLGGFDAYGNSADFYYRAAVFNRMIHAPDGLDFWLTSDWVGYYQKSSKDRETRRLVAQDRKAAKPGRRVPLHLAGRG